jgi:hypothetical protein
LWACRYLRVLLPCSWPVVAALVARVLTPCWQGDLRRAELQELDYHPRRWLAAQVCPMPPLLYSFCAIASRRVVAHGSCPNTQAEGSQVPGHDIVSDQSDPLLGTHLWSRGNTAYGGSDGDFVDDGTIGVKVGFLSHMRAAPPPPVLFLCRAVLCIVHCL